MIIRILICLGLLGLIACPATAASITDPIPYLSQADTPDGFFDHAGIFCLQDFEDPDGPWEDGFSFDGGKRIGPNFVSGDGVPVTDSVDADDGQIDGNSLLGSAWYAEGSRNLMITFDDPTSVAGFVFADGDSIATKVIIAAYGVDGSELITREYDTFLDDAFDGGTQEDRFFGVQADAGEAIKRVRVAMDLGVGFEVDHIQFLKPIPEPASGSLLLLATVLGTAFIRTRRNAAV